MFDGHFGVPSVFLSATKHAKPALPSDLNNESVALNANSLALTRMKLLAKKKASSACKSMTGTTAYLQNLQHQ